MVGAVKCRLAGKNIQHSVNPRLNVSLFQLVIIVLVDLIIFSPYSISMTEKHDLLGYVCKNFFFSVQIFAFLHVRVISRGSFFSAMVVSDVEVPGQLYGGCQLCLDVCGRTVSPQSSRGLSLQLRGSFCALLSHWMG